MKREPKVDDTPAVVGEQARQRLVAALAERYQMPFVRYFMRHVGSRAEAEDLTQEVFLRVLRREVVPDVEYVEAFLFRTAVNLLKDRHRAAKVRASHAKDAALQKAAEEISPERVLMGKQSLRVVLDALGQLNQTTRDMFLLHRLEKMKYQEIADLYGVSVSAVEKHMMKALAHLAKRIRSR
ncbi:MAG: RNA polymerase sigma factor [Sphingomonadales bacterium]